MKKRMDKKPVLTSPWKIGILVSLLLMLVSIWVGFYMVSVGHVEFKWIKASAKGWSIDSYLFFKDMYPIVAGVVFISLFSYFVVASAVRRYRYYLNSGQDYRKLVSLAESIDDLTNPAQIARLSSFPELQDVLRNYGDQIREISQDLGNKESAANLGELESAIGDLLRGECTSEKTFAAKGHTSICRTIRDYVASNRARFNELEKRSEAERTIIGRAALAYSRVMEAISSAGDSLLEIAKSVSELERVAEEICSDAPRAAGADACSQQKTLRAIASEMESSVRKLGDGGQVLHEFSEENNGIAINLALMAARGSVKEHDLATFAERVRATAERFHKLSGTVSSIAQGLLGSCYALKEKTGDAAAVKGSGVSPELQGSIVRIARAIGERSSLLQKEICGLGSELHEVHELLQRDFVTAPGSREAGTKAKPSPEVALEDESSRTDFEEDSCTAEMQKKASELIIDHARSWQGMDAPKEEAEKPERGERPFSFKEMEESKVAGRISRETPGEANRSDFSDMSSLRELETPAGAEAEPSPPRKQSDENESFMEMPGHNWRTVNVEKEEQEDETGRVEVTVETPLQERSQSPAAEPKDRKKRQPIDTAAAEAAAEAAAQAAALEAMKGRPVPETPAEAESIFAKEHEILPKKESEDGEPIHDLFELGAVEYTEDTRTQR